MTCQLIVNNRRPCDGQPNRECPNDCDVDCHFNNATLDRVMNYPLQPVAENRFPDLVEAEENLPWAWVDRLGFWWACVLTGIAAGLGYGLYGLARSFQLF